MQREGVLYKITCKCDKEHIGGIGRKRNTEHERDILLACAQNLVVSEHAIETGPVPIGSRLGFNDHDSYCYTHKDKEAIHVRLHPISVNGDEKIEIPEACMRKIKKHNSRSATKWSYEGTPSNSLNNYEHRNEPMKARYSSP